MLCSTLKAERVKWPTPTANQSCCGLYAMSRPWLLLGPTGSVSQPFCICSSGWWCYSSYALYLQISTDTRECELQEPQGDVGMCCMPDGTLDYRTMMAQTETVCALGSPIFISYVWNDLLNLFHISCAQKSNHIGFVCVKLWTGLYYSDAVLYRSATFSVGFVAHQVFHKLFPEQEFLPRVVVAANNVEDGEADDVDGVNSV